MKISYAVTVFNELEEIKKLIPFLLEHKRDEDEIVVLFDDKGTKEVWEYLLSIENKLGVLSVSNLNGDFSKFKNKLIKLCSGDYIFNIDADELPNSFLILNLEVLLEQNPTIDLFLVPRINIVEGLTEEHIKKWGWNVNEHGWVNWPDFQTRIFRNNSNIFWENKVHEKITGYKEFSILPEFDEWALYHNKDIKRQETQNNFYNTI